MQRFPETASPLPKEKDSLRDPEGGRKGIDGITA